MQVNAGSQNSNPQITVNLSGWPGPSHRLFIELPNHWSTNSHALHPLCFVIPTMQAQGYYSGGSPIIFNGVYSLIGVFRIAALVMKTKSPQFGCNSGPKLEPKSGPMIVNVHTWQQTIFWEWGGGGISAGNNLRWSPYANSPAKDKGCFLKGMCIKAHLEGNFCTPPWPNSPVYLTPHHPGIILGVRGTLRSKIL